MASSIYFNGRRINIPGAYSEIDASALANLGPGATGIVALVGTAEGGKPLSVDPVDADHTRETTIRSRYRSGNLRKAGIFAFGPSSDQAIPGGAQGVVAVKVNPSTQSELTLQDATPEDALKLVSIDYGLFTSQYNVEVEAGTNQGKKYTIVFENRVEIFDDIGGDSVFTAQYTDPGTGWDTMTGQVTASQFLAAATKAESGDATYESGEFSPATTFNVLSDNAGDTTQSIIVYGLDASNNPTMETLNLNGTTQVNGAVSFSQITATESVGTLNGTAQLRDGVTVLQSFSGAATLVGKLETDDMPCASTLSLSIDSATACWVVVRGLNASGAAAAEAFDMTSGSASGSVAFSKITAIELGDVPAARTVTISANTVDTAHSTFTTVQKVVDKINQADGFEAQAQVENPTTFLMNTLDIMDSPVSVLGSAVSFYGNLQAAIEEINSVSGLVRASRPSGAKGAPANTSGPVYLTGGVEGTPTITEWTEAFELLKKRRVNIIVPLTEDPAVHSLLASHLVWRSGVGRSEANGYAGIGTASGAGETRSNIQSQIQVLGTRHISAISQEIQKYDPDTGDATWYPPFMGGVIAGGMQAGSPVGEPLTNKAPSILAIRNDPSWTVEDNGSDLIDRGLMMLTPDDTVGIKWLRSITTHLADDNLVFTEMSANESMNAFVYEFRRRIGLFIGKRGLSSSLAGIKGVGNKIAQDLIDDGFAVAYRALTVERMGDVFPVSFELAPITPINFIPITVHVVAVSSAA